MNDLSAISRAAGSASPGRGRGIGSDCTERQAITYIKCRSARVYFRIGLVSPNHYVPIISPSKKRKQKNGRRRAGSSTLAVTSPVGQKRLNYSRKNGAVTKDLPRVSLKSRLRAWPYRPPSCRAHNIIMVCGDPWSCKIARLSFVDFTSTFGRGCRSVAAIPPAFRNNHHKACLATLETPPEVGLSRKRAISTWPVASPFVRPHGSGTETEQ